MVEVVGHIEGIVRRENGNPFSKQDAELVYSVLREYGFEFSGSFAQAVGVTVPRSEIDTDGEMVNEDTPLILAIKSLIELKRIYAISPDDCGDYDVIDIEIDPDEDVKLILKEK
jgi:hypothetical protein